MAQAAAAAAHGRELESPDGHHIRAGDGKDGPTEVEISLKFVNVMEVDSSKSVAMVDFICVCNWLDPSLIGVRPRTVDWSRTWTPKLAIQNDIDVSIVYTNLRLVHTATGKCQETSRWRGTLTQAFRLQDFPFDAQSLTVKLRCGHPVEKAMLVPHSRRTMTTEEFTLLEWTVGHLSADIRKTDKASSGSGQQYSQLTATLGLMRKWKFFLYNFFLIVFLLASASTAGFCMPVHDLGNRLAVNLTLLLTLTALKLVVADTLPNIPYLTLLDKYVLAATMYLFLVVAENAIMVWASEPSLGLFKPSATASSTPGDHTVSPIASLIIPRLLFWARGLTVEAADALVSQCLFCCWLSVSFVGVIVGFCAVRRSKRKARLKHRHQAVAAVAVHDKVD